MSLLCLHLKSFEQIHVSRLKIIFRQNFVVIALLFWDEPEQRQSINGPEGWWRWLHGLLSSSPPKTSRPPSLSLWTRPAGGRYAAWFSVSSSPRDCTSTVLLAPPPSVFLQSMICRQWLSPLSYGPFPFLPFKSLNWDVLEPSPNYRLSMGVDFFPRWPIPSLHVHFL